MSAQTTATAFHKRRLTDLRIKRGSQNNRPARHHFHHQPAVSTEAAKAAAMRDISADPDFTGKVIWNETRLHQLLNADQQLTPEQRKQMAATLHHERFKPFSIDRWCKGHTLRLKAEKSKSKQMLSLALQA